MSVYQAAAAQQQLGVILGSPSAFVVDVILALSVMFAHRAVFMLVPSTFLSNAPTARVRFLEKVRQSHSMCTVVCPAFPVYAPAPTWLCVFSGVAVMQQLIRSGAPGVVFFS
jgi:hypothetical protein